MFPILFSGNGILFFFFFPLVFQYFWPPVSRSKLKAEAEEMTLYGAVQAASLVLQFMATQWATVL